MEHIDARFEVDLNNNFIDDDDDFDLDPEFDENNNFIDDRFEDDRFAERFGAADQQETAGSVSDVLPQSDQVEPEAGAENTEAKVDEQHDFETVPENTTTSNSGSDFALPALDSFENERESAVIIMQDETKSGNSDSQDEKVTITAAASASVTPCSSEAEPSFVSVDTKASNNSSSHTARDGYRPLAELVREFHRQTPARFHSVRFSDNAPHLPSPFVPHLTVPRSPKFATDRRLSLGAGGAKPCLSNATNTYAFGGRRVESTGAVRSGKVYGSSTMRRSSVRYCPYPVVARRSAQFTDPVKKLFEHVNAHETCDTDRDALITAMEAKDQPELIAIPETELPQLIGNLEVSTGTKPKRLESEVDAQSKIACHSVNSSVVSQPLNALSKTKNRKSGPGLPSSSSSGFARPGACAANKPADGVTFRAQEAKVLRTAPFRPAPSTRPLTVAEPPRFLLPRRAEQRRRFDAMVEEHKSALQRAQLERDRLVREMQAEDCRRLRAASTFRAQPMPRSHRARTAAEQKPDSRESSSAGNKENESRRDSNL